MIPWVILAVGALIILLAVLFWYWKKGKKHTPDYRALFYIGIVWMALGLPYGALFGYPEDGFVNYGFFAMGAVFTVLGLVNKNKWGKHKKWGELSTKERKFKTALIIGLLALVILGLVAYSMMAG